MSALRSARVRREGMFLALLLILTFSPSVSAASGSPSVSVGPQPGAAGVPFDSVIFVVWGEPMALMTTFAVIGPRGPVAGQFDYDLATNTVSFRPSSQLEASTRYTVVVDGQRTYSGREQAQPFFWTFDTVAQTSVSLSDFGGQQRVQASWWWAAWPWLMLIVTGASLTGTMRVWGRSTARTPDTD